MAINPIVDVMAINATQDYTAIKHNEDHKSVNIQNALFEQKEKGAEEKLSEVPELENAQWLEKKMDGRDKGSNQYYGNGGKGRKKDEKKKEEKHEQVIVNGHRSFDIKI